MQLEAPQVNWLELEVEAREEARNEERIYLPGIAPREDSPSLDTLKIGLEYAQQAYESKQREELVNHNIIEVPSEHSLTLIMGTGPGLRTLFVAVKGTTNIENWKDNFNFFAAELSPNGPKVHGGFLRAFRSMQDANGEDLIKHTFNEALFEGKEIDQILVIGHSMGGALALLTGLHISQCGLGFPIHAVLLGCPNVGDQAFVKLCEAQLTSIISFVDPLDPVTKIPPCLKIPGVQVPLSSGVCNWGPGYFAGYQTLKATLSGNFGAALSNLACLTEFWIDECHTVSRYSQRVNLLLNYFQVPDLAQLVTSHLLQNAKKLDQESAHKKMHSMRDSITSYVGTILESLMIDAQAMYRFLEGADWKSQWVKVALIIAALTYVANPWGVIPDFIPLVGRLDDYIVLRIVSRVLEPELAPLRLAIIEERHLESLI